MSKVKYPKPVEIKFTEDHEHFKKGFTHVFGAATAADFMRKGAAWPTTKDEEAKLPETILQIKEQEQEAKNPKKKRF